MACDLFAVDMISSCWRVTVRSYTQNARKGNRIKATADTAKIIGLVVVNPVLVEQQNRLR